MFRVIVAGSRDFVDYSLLSSKLDFFFSRVKPDAIVSGAARGADSLGEIYAKEHGIPINRYPAQWELWGKSAGYKRNEQMADHAEALVAFWDGKSRGTKHMIDYARAVGLKVKVVIYAN